MDPKNTAADIGARILDAYKRAGFNRRQFSLAIDVAYSAVIAWENGDKVPGTESVQAMARVLHVSTDWIITGQNPHALARRKEPGYRKRADSAWQEFVENDSVAKLLRDNELAEVRETQFRHGVPTSPEFYRYIALAKLAHREGDDTAFNQALRADDVTPLWRQGDSVKLDPSKVPQRTRRVSPTKVTKKG